jgi:hypothetical protein
MGNKRIKQFYRFLKEHNIYKAYRINFNTEFSGYPSLKIFLIQIPCDDVIFEAFDWSSTKEGFDFWRDMAVKWENYLEEIRKKEKNERSRNKKI